MTYSSHTRSVRHCLACLSGSLAINNPTATERYVRMALTLDIPLRTCYEIILQSYLFAGFPAAIEGMTILAKVYQEHGMALDISRSEYDVALFTSRGEELCQKIYTTSYTAMRERFENITPDLNDWMIIEGYGKTLSRPGVDLLLREFCIVAILMVLRRTNQMYSHIRGAKHCGASQDDLTVLVSQLAQEDFFSSIFDTIYRTGINQMITTIFTR